LAYDGAMKKRLFSPIVIILGLAILVVSALLVFRPQEEKLIRKVAISSNKLQKLIETRNSKIVQSEGPTPELLTAERIYTEEEIRNTTEQQFYEMLKETEKRLPTLSEIKQVPSGALHHIPPVVLEAGRNLGALKEVFKYHPEYETKAITMYSECAHAENRPMPVRALCLTNLIEVSKKYNLPLDLKSFPNNIVELTKLVTDI
jgi:hypothetical protein